MHMHEPAYSERKMNYNAGLSTRSNLRSFPNRSKFLFRLSIHFLAVMFHTKCTFEHAQAEHYWYSVPLAKHLRSAGMENESCLYDHESLNLTAKRALVQTH